MLDGKNINIKEIVENNYKGFSYGDMTSVAVSPNGEKLAVAIQSSDYSVAGCLAVFLCGADGTLSFDQIYEAGVQPDMVTFTPDSKKIFRQMKANQETAMKREVLTLRERSL